MVAAALLTTGALLSAPAVPASAQPCSDVEVVFARGTGEPPGVGGIGQAFVDALRSKTDGKSVNVYPANYVASGDFTDGIQVAFTVIDGIRDASNHIEATAAQCPDTKIVLGGYSQGAAVIDAIAIADHPQLGFDQVMPASVADHVAAVAVFGNPSIRLLGAPLTTVVTLGSV